MYKTLNFFSLRLEDWTFETKFHVSSESCKKKKSKNYINTVFFFLYDKYFDKNYHQRKKNISIDAGTVNTSQL